MISARRGGRSGVDDRIPYDPCIMELMNSETCLLASERFSKEPMVFGDESHEWVQKLASRLRNGDVGALSRTISLVENRSEKATARCFKICSRILAGPSSWVSPGHRAPAKVRSSIISRES